MPLGICSRAKRGAQASRLCKPLLKWSKKAGIQGRMLRNGKTGDRRRIPIGDKMFFSLSGSFFLGFVHDLGKIRWIC